MLIADNGSLRLDPAEPDADFEPFPDGDDLYLYSV